MKYLFVNAAIVDGVSDQPKPNMSVLVEGGSIKDVRAGKIAADDASKIDLAGKVLMPGLIDCHVHITAVDATFTQSASQPPSLLAFRTAGVLRDMLHRGFTTVRDMGGCDFGLVRAVEQGLIQGPRILMCGRVLSQTGGHGDFRGRYDERPPSDCCRKLGVIARLCDGVDEVRRACREEIKAGADFIKLMANGGCTSPTDPIESVQFSRDEIRAAVEEAENAQTYVAAHLYTDQAIRRAVELGVRSVEHCNLITPETAQIMRERHAFACPTLITHFAVKEQSAALNLAADVVEKTEQVRLGGLEALSILRDAGVAMTFGSDLLGPMQARQSEEFLIRGQVLPAQEVVRAATVEAARLLRMEGKIGCIEPEAHADLIVVNGNPLKNIGILAQPDNNIPFVMKGGTIINNRLC